MRGRERGGRPQNEPNFATAKPYGMAEFQQDTESAEGMCAGVAKPIGMGRGVPWKTHIRLLTRYNGEMGSDMGSSLFSAKQS